MNRPEVNYFILPWYRKLYYNTCDKIKEIFKKITTINYKFLIIMAMVILVIVLLFCITLMNKEQFQVRDAYDKTDYVSISSIDTDKEIVLTNSKYDFNFDPKTTRFNVVDKNNNNVWYSNPQNVNPSAMEVNELFYIYYSTTLELPKRMSVRTKSIDNQDYQLKISEDAIEVLYTVGNQTGISINDIPTWINKDTFEEKIKPVLTELLDSDDRQTRIDAKFVLTKYTYVEKSNAYFCSLDKTATQNSLEVVYNMLFNKAGYTQEEFEEDQKAHGVEVESTPIFEFAVRYELTDLGLDVSIINDSIYEKEKFPLTYIDVLPYFGSAQMDDNGYIMIPDGSGMLIDYNSQKYTSSYSKRVYGVDRSIEQYATALNHTDYNGLNSPLYGMTTNGVGFINVINSGAAMCSLNASFTQAQSGGSLLYKYPNASYRFYNREYDYSMFGQGDNAIPIYAWTREYNKENFSSSYIFSTDSDYNYVDMAKDYQNYLVNDGTLKDKQDTTTSPVMNVSLLGGYKYKDSFLGIPYEKVGSLTNTDQAKIIANLFLDANVSNLNIGYQGWSNDGIKPTYSGDVYFNSVVGNKNDFKDLNKYLESKDVNLVLESYINNAFSDKGIKSKDIAQSMYKNDVSRTPQEYASSEWFKDGFYLSQYTLTPDKLPTLAKSLNKTYEKIGLNSIGLMDFSSELNSTLGNYGVSFRNESLNSYNDAAKYLSENFDYIQDRNPNIYGVKYLTNVLDLPVSADNLNIMTASIPFIQLVLNGYVDYSAQSFNLDDTNNNDYYKLKAIETGGNINYTLSYDSTIKLATTEYNYYYSTYYKNWMDEAINMYNDLNALGIYNAKISNHELLNIDGSKVRVTYTNGKIFDIDYSNLTVNQTGGN